MTLKLAKPTTAKLEFRKTWQPMDADAAAYITAVETADGQALEEKTKIAIDNFVLGCKADGIWSAIKASCILAGARTLQGALVPLTGTAPTNYNFVSGDYNRKTGLAGNGSTKYLDTNRNGNTDPQNSRHLAVYISSVASTTRSGFIGALPSSGSFTYLYKDISYRSTMSMAIEVIWGPQATGLFGSSRSISSSLSARFGGTLYSASSTSSSPGDLGLNVFRLNRTTGDFFYSDARLAFYSIGESLDLALLDARVTDLINAFGAAIP